MEYNKFWVKRKQDARWAARPKLFYNYNNLKLKNSQSTIKKVWRKKILFILVHFKDTSNLIFQR